MDFLSIRFGDRRSSVPKHGKIRQVAKLCHDIHPETFHTGCLATVVDGVPSIQDARIKARNGYPDGIQLAKHGVQTFKIPLLREDQKVDIFAKLGCAVEHAGLAAHKQRLNLMFLDRRKDLSDRGRDQGYLPWLSIERRFSRFPGSAPAG